MTGAIKGELIFTSVLSSSTVSARAEPPRRRDRQLVQSVRTNCTGGQSCPQQRLLRSLSPRARPRGMGVADAEEVSDDGASARRSRAIPNDEVSAAPK
jgi:hypothetical protein